MHEEKICFKTTCLIEKKSLARSSKLKKKIYNKITQKYQIWPNAYDKKNLVAALLLSSLVFVEIVGFSANFQQIIYNDFAFGFELFVFLRCFLI